MKKLTDEMRFRIETVRVMLDMMRTFTAIVKVLPAEQIGEPLEAMNRMQQRIESIVQSLDKEAGNA